MSLTGGGAVLWACAGAGLPSASAGEYVS